MRPPRPVLLIILEYLVLAALVPHADAGTANTAQTQNLPPIITAPAVVHAVPFAPLTFEVSVADPDGDPIQDLNAYLGIPGFFGATFDESPDHTRGTFSWTPGTDFAFPAESDRLDVSFYASDDGVRIVVATTTIYLSYIDLDHLDANGMDLTVGNSGQVGYDADLRQAALVYPKGSSKTLLYAMGPWVGGKEGGTLRVSRGGVQTELLPGTMTGTTATPFVPRFKNYVIRRGDMTSDDYLNWPVSDGAPVDAAGQPRLDGDQMVWSVYNEFGQRNRTGGGWEFSDGTAPVGLEFRQASFGFAVPGPLANVDFFRFSLTNRSGVPLDSMHFALWADADIGGAQDDLAGFDPTLGFGYVYNAAGLDAEYGGAPPALGFVLLQGSMPQAADDVANAFTSYNLAQLPRAGITATGSFLMMQGRNLDGTPMHRGDDPAQPTTMYRYDGDPLNGTGWLDATPADKRIVISTGVSSFGPGETKEYLAAVVVGQGGDRLTSVQALRDLVPIARYVAASGFTLLPYVKAPAEVTVAEGTPLAVPIEALDLDGDGLTSLTADLSGLPLGNDAHFAPNINATGGLFTWTPGFTDAGSYVVPFTAANDKSATVSVRIQVLNTDRAPVADAGGPYAGLVGQPLECTAARSNDPDGDQLTYAWIFGDGGSGTGVAVQHTYQSASNFDVVLRVSDGSLADIDSTSASIASSVPARAFVLQQDATIRLSSARPLYAVELEPVDHSFELSQVEENSIRLVSEGTGSLDAIAPSAGKPSRGFDRDHNGVAELNVLFGRDNLRLLFDALPGGQQVVAVTVQGVLNSGARFQAPVSLHIVSSHPLTSSVAPNPMNPDATITFRMTRPGRVRVSLLDVQGRVVRVLRDSALGVGYHDVRVTASTGGPTLSSGVYFYAIEAPEGIERGRLVVLK